MSAEDEPATLVAVNEPAMLPMPTVPFIEPSAWALPWTRKRRGSGGPRRSFRGYRPGQKLIQTPLRQ